MLDINLIDLCQAEHYVYENGTNGSSVELYKVINGGHTWPGSNFSSGITNYDINACVEIWKFFSRYDINGLIGTTTLIENDIIKNKHLVKITDILGRETNLTTNSLLLYIYDDGTVEKIIALKK